MNSFGQIFRTSIYGESHGVGIGVVLDGVLPGIEIDLNQLQDELNRRKSGGVGTTKRVEDDIPEILSGVKNGVTTGAPINIFFRNKNVDSKSYENFKEHPRPGHADFSSTYKYYGFNDLRGSGHFSGRLTVGIVASGYIAKKILEKLVTGVEIGSSIVKLGKEYIADLTKENIKENLLKVTELGDSLGGVIKCKVKNLPVGLGEPFFDSVESTISHGIFSIPGIKGIEFGTGFEGCSKLGSEYNDLFINEKGETETNNSGGINGGITNGNPVEFNVAVKPTSSISKEQSSFNFSTGKIEKISVKGRHDVAFILRVPVVVEAITAMVFADLMLRGRE